MHTKTGKRVQCIVFALIISSSALFAEQDFIITGEIFEISGRTKEQALTNILGSAKGHSFKSQEELEVYVQNRAQKIDNLRAFEKSSIEILYPELPATGTTSVVLKTTIEDSTSFFPIPYAFYNSNDGFQAGTILTMPNAGGTLQNLMVIGLYTAPPDENDMLQWTNPNFMLLGTWSGIRFNPFTLAFSGIAMKMNQKIESRGIQKIKVNSTVLSGSVSLSYALAASLSDSLSFRFAGSPESTIIGTTDPSFLSYGPYDSSWEIKNSLVYSKYNWNGNFREGRKADISVSYTASKPSYAEKNESLMGELEIAEYFIWGTRFNPSFRFYSFINSGLPQLQNARYIRGIRNTELSGNIGVFLNSGLQVKLVRFGSAELHVAPGFDYAFVTVYSDPDYTTENGFGIGGDFILILDSLKTFPIKLGIAYDLRPKYADDPAKRLEIDFNFSFSY